MERYTAACKGRARPANRPVCGSDVLAKKPGDLDEAEMRRCGFVVNSVDRSDRHGVSGHLTRRIAPVL